MIRLLGIAKYLLGFGLLMLGMAVYAVYRAGTGGGIPAESQLTSVTGAVQGGREVTVEHKRRRGGKSYSKFFELDFQPDGGAPMLKLRVDHEVPIERLQASLSSTQVTARYEAGDVNMVYSLQAGGTSLLGYEEMARMMQARADKAKSADASAGTLLTGFLLTAVGLAGVLWRRKLVAAQA